MTIRSSRNGLSGMFAGEPGSRSSREARRWLRGGPSRSGARVPDVILMDLRMPGMDGVRAIAALTADSIQARVLVLTTYDTDSEVLAAIEAGTTGYLLKASPANDLFRAVRAAARARDRVLPDGRHARRRADAGTDSGADQPPSSRSSS